MTSPAGACRPPAALLVCHCLLLWFSSDLCSQALVMGLCLRSSPLLPAPGSTLHPLPQACVLSRQKILEMRMCLGRGLCLCAQPSFGILAETVIF